MACFGGLCTDHRNGGKQSKGEQFTFHKNNYKGSLHPDLENSIDVIEPRPSSIFANE